MTRSVAIDKILSDLSLPRAYEDYVLQTMGRLGCGVTIDIATVKALEQVILNEMRQ